LNKKPRLSDAAFYCLADFALDISTRRLDRIAPLVCAEQMIAGEQDKLGI
jgi:hypothetical protein